MINASLFFENKLKKMLIKFISTSQYFVKMHSYENNISSFLIKMCPLFVVIVDVVVVVNVSHLYFFSPEPLGQFNQTYHKAVLGKSFLILLK